MNGHATANDGYLSADICEGVKVSGHSSKTHSPGLHN